MTDTEMRQQEEKQYDKIADIILCSDDLEESKQRIKDRSWIKINSNSYFDIIPAPSYPGTGYKGEQDSTKGDMQMIDKIPDMEQMTALLGQPLYDVWQALCTAIEERYEMERQWDSGGKAWKYGYRYRRGGKTLCTLYAREDSMGMMVIFGKGEREKFEAERQTYPQRIQQIYDEAETYHDGKWVLFELSDKSLIEDLVRLLHIKRRPNRK